MLAAIAIAGWLLAILGWIKAWGEEARANDYRARYLRSRFHVVINPTVEGEVPNV